MNSQRLIEAGFPCHQVGAETQRERGASSALPPLYFMHVDSDGQPQRYGSGGRSGEIKTKKIRFIRPPNERDLEALAEAEKQLAGQ